MFALEFDRVGLEGSVSTKYSGMADATARLKYIFLPEAAAVVKRRKSEAIAELLRRC
jgi:hypothetical protein